MILVFQIIIHRVQLSCKNTVPYGAAYKISCTDPQFYREPVIPKHDNSGKSVAERFLDSIQHDAREIREILKYKVPMLPLTDAEKTVFDSPHAVCHICKKGIESNEIRVRDHCYLTGHYHGPTYQDCNLKYRINPDKIQIPCFFHNLKHYDGHLLIAAVKKRHGKITVIPTTTEKYISFTIGDVVFKDSLAFTQASLDSLFNNLEPAQLVNTRRWLESNMRRHGGDDNDDDGIDNDDDLDQPIEYGLTFIDHRHGPSTRRYFIADDGDDVYVAPAKSRPR